MSNAAPAAITATATPAEKPAKKSRKLLFIVAALILVLAVGGGGGFYFLRAKTAAKEEAAKKSKAAKKNKEEEESASEEETSEDEKSDGEHAKDKHDEATSKEESAKGEKPEAKSKSLKSLLPDDEEVKQIVELQPFVINLADTDEPRYLRLTVSIGVGGEGKEEKPDPVFTTRVRNALLAVLTTKKSTDVLTVEGKAALRRELLKIAQASVEEPHIQAIYITEFIVQM